MAGPSSAEGGKKARLLRAQPLQPEPQAQSSPVIPVSAQGPPPQPAPSGGQSPPAPIPLQGYAPQQGLPPAPIPMNVGGAYAPQPAPGQPWPAPAAPIPVQPESGPAAPGPAPQSPAGPVRVQPVENRGPAETPEADRGPSSDPKAAPSAKKPASAAAAATAAATATSSPDQAPAGGPARPILLTEEQKQKRSAVVSEHKGRKAVGAREEIEEAEELGPWGLFWRDVLDNHRSLLTSAVVHVLGLLVLAFVFLPVMREQINLISTAPEPIEDFELDEFEDVELEDIGEIQHDIVDRVDPLPLEPLVDRQLAAEGINAASVELIENSLEKAVFNDILCELGRGTGDANARGTGKGKQGTGFGLGGPGKGLGGRGGRRGNAEKFGATKESEAAVDLALKWLAEHQLPDGSWNFNHQVAPTCQGKCSAPGDLPEARNAATAFGILPFLGAGQTHQVGQYKKTVAGGLNYLIGHMQVGPNGGSLKEPGGRMYAHGLATIALCEAYAMNMDPEALRKKKRAAYHGEGAPAYKDEARLSDSEEKAIDALADRLGPAAQLALNYVMYAQDPNGGGWRYEPRTPGDTSVVGWQLMALMSGRMAYLHVDPRCFAAATVYLNHVQRDDYGSDYGYTGPDRGSQATQSIGLLSRMYLGWAKDHPGIVQGVQTMGGQGPSRSNMYYNYYATQVMHHYGGEDFKRWNRVMRDSLVNSQSHAGHEAGSWMFQGGDHGSSKGGRLYCTAMAAMTLEVYYRHMPLYGENIFAAAAAADQEQQKKKDPFAELGEP